VLTLTSETREKENQPRSEQRENLEKVYRSLLKIVARFEESTYTDSQVRQTTEQQLDDLADPASGLNTSQG
jgi:hypothetical protein